VIAGLPPADWVTWWTLVPNLKGRDLAVAVGVDHLTVTVSASPEYSRRNVHMSVEESLAQAEEIAASEGITVDVVISCAFGSPYEPYDAGTSPAQLGRMVDRCRAAGASVTLADTTGVAGPKRVAEVLAVTGPDVGAHFHDTRGTALLNAYAAMDLGVTRFDTAVGGLGGSPFASGAGGNLATEDLVHLCDGEGVATGIDLGGVLAASALVAKLIGRAVPSRVAAAGPPNIDP
jgi:hydroxymethylglutaryl-CoA lyase